MAGQWHLDAASYLAVVRAEVPRYDELQDRLAATTADVPARSILDLGSGTGVTAERVLARHPGASLVGVDASAAMVEQARRALPAATFVVGRLEEPLPAGPFDLVVSAFAVHHLHGDGKAELFQRVADVLAPGGRLVLGDVVVPTRPVPRPVPLEPGVDRPDTVAAQLGWLAEAGLVASVAFEQADLAILRGDRP